MVLLMPLFPGTSVPTKFEEMTRKWRAYCKFRKRKPILMRIKMDTVNYGPLEWPDGGWQKADTTTLLCVACQCFIVLFVFWCACLLLCSAFDARSAEGDLVMILPSEEWLEHEMVEPLLKNQLHLDRRFLLILAMVRDINGMFRELFSRGAWLRSHEAELAGQLGMRALRCYHQLAEESVALSQPRFPVHPKFHALWRIFHALTEGAKVLRWVESPLSDSCQQDESFVGIISRYSRRVSPKQTISRAIDLYLTSLWKLWRGEDA